MESVEEFLRALDSIEAEIRQIPDVVFVEMSLTRGDMTGDLKDLIDETSRYIMLLSSKSILANWDDLCFDIGGPEFPFVWSLKTSQLYESFPTKLAIEREPVEFAVWYYLDSWRSPVPDHWLDTLPPDEDHWREDGLAAMVYKTEMDRVFQVMRSLKTAWSLAPESVIREFGDLTKFPTARREGGDDDFDLWWPAVLLYLALRKVDVVLSANAAMHIPFDSIFDDLPEGGDHQACIDAFEPTTWTVSLGIPSLMAATSCALRAVRRVAESGGKASESFKWSAPMLEGYVLRLLKEREDPTEREAVEWIAGTTRKPEPSRSTLRKTYFWKNRLKKMPKSRITTESQSGVSPAQNSDVRVSHIDVTNAVLDIEDKLNRQLVDNERDAVEWTLEQAGPNEKEREEAICQLIEGLRRAQT